MSNKFSFQSQVCIEIPYFRLATVIFISSEMFIYTDIKKGPELLFTQNCICMGTVNKLRFDLKKTMEMRKEQ